MSTHILMIAKMKSLKFDNISYVPRKKLNRIKDLELETALYVIR